MTTTPIVPELPDTKGLQRLDAAHYMHPFTDHAALAQQGARVMVRGDGIYLWDSDGRKVLDAMSGLWCVNVGYGRRSMTEAVARQMDTLPFYNSFFNTTTIPAVQLAAKLAKLAPAGFDHVFFTGSGSEANDTNVRMVRRYWDLAGQPERTVIISRHNAYHGSTMAGASLGGMSGMHVQGGLPIPGIVHIGQPYYADHGAGMTPEEFGIHAAGWLEERIRELGPDKVAAFIGEPVQGAGGVIIPPATYWPEIRRICDKYDVLLIADEVITGFGRLGTWFASELYGIRPDLITFAKGVTSGYIPLGGVLVGDRVAQVLIAGGDFNHGFTYSGHPVACAAALENIRILEDEKLVDQVAHDTGPYLKERFAALAAHPLVGTAESLGFVAGLSLVKRKAASVHDQVRFDPALGVGMICRAHMFGNGIIMRAVGDRMIIAPPLVTTREQVDEMIGKIRLCLDLTLADLMAQGRLG
ncbi:aminotransferase class III-fold pyridoxal phosphate-dependent enzyme [Massilia dura]|uniref:Aminotransferase class III-fold pyridoxal phosphate-dependent enzyme n=1 Tax=Pseudoduganella dura TaxID=321982 RepID=A0A6I3XHF5_9BURK|nr:aspartate aminotransferase family protein [Pseudoduganella dura]MUI14000.1 aminotransferase class III-fold pyridoxal phosphate-dependent enzyme [Pseudoduganella dura]GGX91818.1 aspartate aminotransferase family protein [Pseudoduganella dura]